MAVRKAKVQVMGLFSKGEESQISQAITEAELGTSGEIVVVVAAQSDGYYYVPIMIAALVALLVPWLLIYFAWVPVEQIYLAQLAVFVALFAVLWPATIRAALVPPSIKQRNAHRRASEQFISQNLHTTAGRTGVLIYVSVLERYVEVLADSEINSKVAPGTWQKVVDRLTGKLAADQAAEGFVDAISTVGKLLAEHFPPGSEDANELPDHLIVLQ